MVSGRNACQHQMGMFGSGCLHSSVLVEVCRSRSKAVGVVPQLPWMNGAVFNLIKCTRYITLYHTYELSGMPGESGDR